MGWLFYLAQVIGVLTTVIVVIANQLKHMRYILLCQMSVNLLCVISSALLSAWSGVWICAVAVVQTYVLYLLDKKDAPEKLRKWMIWLFVILYIAGTAVVYSSWRDLMSCGGALLFSLSVSQKKASRCRIYGGINGLLWTVYYLSTLNFGTALTNAVGLVSAVVGIIRLDLKKKNA